MTTQKAIFDRIRGFLILAVLLLAGLNNGPASAQGASSTPRTPAQLEQLVAPIALYPDALLSQVLMASTYPLEVVAAARWAQANPGVTGQALEDAMQKQPWDPSVKALTAVPQTLQMMNDKLDWTQELGDAFLAQQGNVLDAVQRLRARADAAGQLKTTEHQTVTKTAAPAATGRQSSTPPNVSAAPGSVSAAPATYYTIASTNPDEYYVPIYDPAVVYGVWPYPDYPPYYWYPPGYYPGTGLAFAAAAVVGAAIWGGINWVNRSVNVDVNRYNRFNRTNIANGNWTHNVAHRGAVPYRDRDVAQRFGNPGQNAAREAFRGTADAGRSQIANQPANSKLGQDGKLGQKGATQPKAGARPANTKEAANRPASKEGAGKGAKQTANTKQAKQTGNSKQAKETGGNTKQAAANRPKQTAKPKQGGGNRVAQNKGAGPRPSARPGGARAASTVGARGGGGGRGGGGRGGGRRSDIRLKHDIALLGHLDNSLGFYRFSYNDSDKAYVGVMAQEVQAVMPEAVIRGRDGYLEVLYDRIGLKFQTYDQWVALGARIPSTARSRH
jgi:hypothetical protein